MKTVIEMADECGIPEFVNNESQAENIMQFAELVRADEREACAKVCEEMRTYVGRNNAVTQSSAQDCASAIRARSNT